MPADETFLSFRVRGGFDPDVVSDGLGLTPTRCWRVGDLVGNGSTGRTHRFDGWILDTRGVVDSDEIAEHLDWLLDRIEPGAAVIAELLAAGTDVDVDCFWAVEPDDDDGPWASMGGGPWIPPRAMARLGALGLPLLISIY